MVPGVDKWMLQHVTGKQNPGMPGAPGGKKIIHLSPPVLSGSHPHRMSPSPSRHILLKTPYNHSRPEQLAPIRVSDGLVTSPIGETGPELNGVGSRVVAGGMVIVADEKG